MARRTDAVYLTKVIPLRHDEDVRRAIGDMGKKTVRVVQGYRVLTKLDEERNTRKTLLIPTNYKGTAYLLITSATHITAVKSLTQQLNQFFGDYNRVIEHQRRTTYKHFKVLVHFCLYADPGKETFEPVAMAKLYSDVPIKFNNLNETTEFAKLLFENGCRDRKGHRLAIPAVKTYDQIPEEYATLKTSEYVIVSTRERKSLGGIYRTRYFLLLAR